MVFAQFIEGLLAELPAKNGWTPAERAGHVTADRMQWLLNGSVWDADLLRDAVRDYVVTHLGDADASLVIDDTQAQKKGTTSVGVGFQHCGLTGDVRTQPELAIAMLDRVKAADVPFAWILADAGYGRDPQLRAWCHRQLAPYVFGVPVDLPLNGPPGKPRQPAVDRADDLLHYAKARDQWARRSCGDGSKSERLYDWTAFAVKVKDEAPADGFAHWLVLRRFLHPNRRGKDGEPRREVAYFLVHALRTPTSLRSLRGSVAAGRSRRTTSSTNSSSASRSTRSASGRPGTGTSPPACWPAPSSPFNAPPSPVPPWSRTLTWEKVRASARARPLADPRTAAAALGPHHPALPGRYPAQPPPPRRNCPDLRVMAPTASDPSHGQPLPTTRRPPPTTPTTLGTPQTDPTDQRPSI